MSFLYGMMVTLLEQISKSSFGSSELCSISVVPVCMVDRWSSRFLPNFAKVQGTLVAVVVVLLETVYYVEDDVFDKLYNWKLSALFALKIELDVGKGAIKKSSK